MTHADTLLQAIIEAPDDDTLRLVYADWLEEHGQDAQADLIRVQCQLAGMAWNDPQRPRLWKREQWLVRQHKWEWVGPLPKGVYFDRFDRGLPEVKVRATARNFLAKAERWFGQTRPHVSFKVQLTAVRPHWTALLGLPYLVRLSELRVVVDELRDTEVEALATCTSFNRLAILDLFHNPLTDAAANSLAASCHLSRLRQLNLSFTRIGPAGVRAIVTSPNLGQLRMLDLQNTEIGDAGVEVLASSPAAARLTWLNLAGCSVTERGASALASSPYLSRLRCLRLWSNGLDMQVLEALRARFGAGVAL